MASFLYAIELGVDMIELDVHLSRDGELVVIHDETLERTTDGRGRVADKTLRELKKLRIEFEKQIPTLREVLDQMNDRVMINIELKGRGTGIKTALVLGEYICRRKWQRGKFLVSSFDCGELEKFSTLRTGAGIGVIFGTRYFRWSLGRLLLDVPFSLTEKATTVNASSVHVPLAYASAELIDAIHKNNLQAFVWTVNDKEDIERMKRLEVDGMFSDYPDRLK